MKRKIVAVGALILLIYPSFDTKAQAIAAPQCKDIPSCGVAGIVIGTEIIAGVLYYIVKSASGYVHKVRSRSTGAKRPSQMNIHTQEEAEGWKLDGLVDNREQCVRKALIKSEATGKRWTSKIKPAGIISPSGRPQYFCYLKEVED